MTNINEENLKNFLQVFDEPIVKILGKDLDTEICNDIKLSFDSVLQAAAIEDLKTNNIIYKLDYATSDKQGNLALLVPEELIASIADILTGGNGQSAYKGSISEIEINSVSKIFTQIFKDVESKFKLKYDLDLIFSSNPSFTVKEMEDFQINTEEHLFDLALRYKLTLNDKIQHDVDVLLSQSIVEHLLIILGFSKAGGAQRKSGPDSINLNCLSDVRINITAELGRTRVPIKYALELVRGSLVELDTQNNADIKVFANGVEFAYAQVVAIEDNFGLKITKIITPEERINCL